jgi:putative acetyltransferase
VELRVERPVDLDEIRHVHRAAFGEDGQGVADLTDALRASVAKEDRLSLVAVERRVVGHILFSRGWLDAPTRLVEVQVLSPLGVLPQRQPHFRLLAGVPPRPCAFPTRPSRRSVSGPSRG